MPNNFAYFALIIWPFISILFYKKLPIVHATFWTIVGGFLLLPVKTAIDFPFIPPLDKESIPAIMALVGCRYIKKIKIKLLSGSGVERWLIIVLLVTPFITMINNQEPFRFIPGLTLHDTISSVIGLYLKILPFIIGLQLIKTYEDQLALIKLLVIACLLYSLPVLFEVRMSPQLHTWIYGFFPHSFGQQMRYGGFRPVVFLGHGLLVSMFVAIALGATAILFREKIKVHKIPSGVVIIYFLLILFMCKTIGSFLLGVILLVLIAWMPINIVKRASLVIVFIVMAYPLLSILDLFPHQKLIQMATDFDPDRGQSLGFRFFHENILLQHAQQKLFFGWGGWGRNRLEESVTDGYWIQVFGQYGIFGFASLFGLLALSVWRSIKLSSLLKSKDEQILLLCHAVIISVVLINQLPNSSLGAWVIFLSGALFGRGSFINVYNRNRFT